MAARRFASKQKRCQGQFLGGYLSKHIAPGTTVFRGKHQPRPGELTIWFTSMRSLGEVPSDDNRALLRLIREQKSESLSQFAQFSELPRGNLSRTPRRWSAIV